MAEGNIDTKPFVNSTGQFTWLEAVDSANSNRKARIQANGFSSYPHYFITEDGGTTWTDHGIPITNTGILWVEFNIWTANDLISITFWNSPTTYFRLCIGINSCKTLFCEYYNGSATTRLWTATVS